jgi:ABC-type polar amino acid transport system ATPase subunit
MTNLSHRAQVKKAEDLLKQVGLLEHKKKNPNQLSGGQNNVLQLHVHLPMTQTLLSLMNRRALWIHKIRGMF